MLKCIYCGWLRQQTSENPSLEDTILLRLQLTCNYQYYIIVTTNLASYNDTIFHCIYCDPNTRQPIVAFHLTITITSVLHNFLLLLYNMTGTAI